MTVFSQLKISKWLKLLLLCSMSSLLIACSSKLVKTTDVTHVIQETNEISESELLDIGVLIFDPGLENIEELEEDEVIFADVRAAESRYFPFLLVDALQQSSAWGAIRLIPSTQSAVDVVVSGKIIKSDGESLIISVEVKDATGKLWFNKQYKNIASKYSYKKQRRPTQQFNEPFQNVYNNIANDIYKYKKQLDKQQINNVRKVAELRFAQSFAPDVFNDYLSKDKSGNYKLSRLPAENDPMLNRIRQIRERDYLFVDTMQEYYGTFVKDMKIPYQQWRQESYHEVMSLRSLKTSARNSKVAGFASIIAGLLASGNADPTVRAAGNIAVLGGGYVIKSGFDKDSESQIHVETLQELGDSLEGSIAPQIIELEDRTVTLTGTVVNQYIQWRKILHDIYQIDADTNNVIQQ